MTLKILCYVALDLVMPLHACVILCLICVDLCHPCLRSLICIVFHNCIGSRFLLAPMLNYSDVAHGRFAWILKFRRDVRTIDYRLRSIRDRIALSRTNQLTTIWRTLGHL